MQNNLIEAFSALGDSTRFTIVERLLRDGEQSAGELVNAVDVSAPAVSRHLKILRRAGVVDRRVDRQRRLYTVKSELIEAINDWTMDHRAFWSGSLDRLEAVLSEDPQDD